MYDGKYKQISGLNFYRKLMKRNFSPTTNYQLKVKNSIFVIAWFHWLIDKLFLIYGPTLFN